MRELFKKYSKQIAIILYISILGIIYYLQPPIFFTETGTLKRIGPNDRLHTMIPFWLFAIMLVFVIYFGIMVVAYGSTGKILMMGGGTTAAADLLRGGGREARALLNLIPGSQA
jgi:uncharacterized membrane protein YdbT with pleckstrin-like domain